MEVMEEDTAESEIERDDAEELRRLYEATNEDGTIDAEILDWEREGAEVVVSLYHPTQGEIKRTFDWPEVADGESDFERLVNAALLNLDEAERLRDESRTVPIEKVDGEWKVSTSPSHDIETPSIGAWGMKAFLAPVMLLFMCIMGYTNKGKVKSPHVRETVAEVVPVVIGCIIWTAAIVAVFV